jgi:hypothetical protein
MGISLYKRCSSSLYAVNNSNPDPKRYTILLHSQINDYLMVVVHYPNCTNFEGLKVMVYEYIHSIEELIQKTKGELDPHFSKDGVSPIARFKPTKEGIEMAKKFMEYKQ